MGHSQNTRNESPGTYGRRVRQRAAMFECGRDRRFAAPCNRCRSLEVQKPLRIGIGKQFGCYSQAGARPGNRFIFANIHHAAGLRRDERRLPVSHVSQGSSCDLYGTTSHSDWYADVAETPLWGRPSAERARHRGDGWEETRSYPVCFPDLLSVFSRARPLIRF